MNKQNTGLMDINKYPDDWRIVNLGEVAIFQNGKSSPKRDDNFGHPVFGSNGIIGFSNKSNAEPGTIVVGRVGSYCGSLYYSNQSCWVTDNAIRTKAKEGCDSKYLYYLMQILNLNSKRGGSGQPLLNQRILKSITVALPNNNEQKEIASILSSLDDKIELNKKTNKTLEKIGKAIFKRWFVDFEFPHDEGISYKSDGGEMVDSELGEIPKGWEVKKIGAFINFSKGKRPAKKYDVCKDNYLPELLISTFDSDESQYANPKNLVVCEKHEPIMVMDGASSGRIEIGYHGIVGSTLARVDVHDLGNYLMFIYLKLMQKDINNNTTGTSIPHTDKNRILNYQLAVPKDREITVKLNSMIKDFYLQIFSNKKENRILSEIRDLLLPRLMTGKLRI